MVTALDLACFSLPGHQHAEFVNLTMSPGLYPQHAGNYTKEDGAGWHFSKLAFSAMI